MTVAELIETLRAMPQDAVVLIEDATAHPGPGVRRLTLGEVSRLDAGTWESNGMLFYEPWRDDGSNEQRMDGPYPTVLLGSL
jgi:hypothetical protein